MAIVELFDKHEVNDIVEVNGEFHVIITVFDEQAYQTMSLKHYIETHMTISDLINNEINRLLEEGHV